MIEVVPGNVANRGTIIPLEALVAHKNTAQRLNQPLYRSYYVFDQEVAEYLKTRKSIARFDGMCYLDKLTFDIDKGDNTDEHTLTVARIFVKNLVDNWLKDLDHVQCWFSGRGYHFVTPDFFGFTPSPTLHRQVSATLGKHFPSGDNIYDKTRIIRVGQTLNDKVGLYKIPLTHEELTTLTAAQIADLAKAPRRRFQFPKAPQEAPRYPHLIVATPTAPSRQVALTTPLTDFVTCMQKLYASGEAVGSRHQDLLRLASAYRRMGLPREAVITMLSQWAKSLDPAEVTTIIDSVYKNGYEYGCQDPTMVKFCDPLCRYYRDRNNTIKVYSMRELESAYTHWVRTDFTQTSFSFSEIFPMDEWRLYPQELVIMWGDTGLGKSAFWQYVAVHLPRMKTLYVNTEVSAHLMYRRMVQMKHNLTKEMTEGYYKDNDNHLSNSLDHIFMIDTALTLQQLEAIAREAKPGLIVVDVIDGVIPGIISADLAKDTAVAVGLKQMAKRLGLIIVGVHHISKSAAQDERGNARALTVHSGKGASAYEQKADRVLGIEALPLRGTTARLIRVLKSRDDSKFELALDMDPTTMSFAMLPMARPIIHQP